MRAGEFPDGAHVLRAKIDMASPNFNMRDPVLYRILHAHHHRTGDAWCIYPMYDYAHRCRTRSSASPTRSARWSSRITGRSTTGCVEHLFDGDRPQQIEFARLNLTYTVMSKRKLLQLVQQQHVAGWDDPRMPTISGLRRRGYTPEAIRDFCARIGVAKKENVIDMALLEHSVREDLNRRSPRVMAVLRPLKVVIANYPEGQVEEVDAINNPEDPSAGTRKVPFSRELYIERDDFREDPPKKFFRLSPGREVRLRYAYFITCHEVVKDEQRRGRRAALHLRSGDPRRRRARRPEGEGHAALGVGAARASRRGAPLRPPVLGRGSRVGPRGPDLPRLHQPALARSARAAVRPRPALRRAAVSAPVPVRAHRLLLRRSRLHARARSSSTAPCRCATPGRRSNRSSVKSPYGPLMPEPDSFLQGSLRVDPRTSVRVLQNRLADARRLCDAGYRRDALAAVDAALSIDPRCLAAQSLRETILKSPVHAPQPSGFGHRRATTDSLSSQDLASRARLEDGEHDSGCCCHTPRAAAAVALSDFPSEADGSPGMVPNERPPVNRHATDLRLHSEAQTVRDRARDGQTAARLVEVARREAIDSAGLGKGRDASSNALPLSLKGFAGTAGNTRPRARDSRAVRSGRKSPVALVAAVFLAALGGAAWLGWQWRMPLAHDGTVIADATAVSKHDNQPSHLESFESRAAVPLIAGSSVRTAPTGGNPGAQADRICESHSCRSATGRTTSDRKSSDRKQGAAGCRA